MKKNKKVNNVQPDDLNVVLCEDDPIIEEVEPSPEVLEEEGDPIVETEDPNDSQVGDYEMGEIIAEETSDPEDQIAEDQMIMEKAEQIAKEDQGVDADDEYYHGDGLEDDDDGIFYDRDEEDNWD